MQPYSYAAYPNPNGAAIPVRYMVPANYRQSSPPFVNQPFDPYAGIRSTVRPNQYVPQSFRYPAPGLPPPPMVAMMPVAASSRLQHPRAYYYAPNDSNGVNPAVPSKAKTEKNAPTGAQNQATKSTLSNNNGNDLLKQKGTKIKVSHIYRIRKMNSGLEGNGSSEDEYELLAADSPQPGTLKQSSVQSNGATVKIERVPSAVSSCSHCSTCTNCSCSDCLNQNGSNGYDDCPQCRAEWEREQAEAGRQKRK